MKLPRLQSLKSLGLRLPILLIFLFVIPGEAQFANFAFRAGRGIVWTWVSGSSAAGPAGVWGTKGIGSTSNFPGGRTLSCGAVDSSDNLWMFGGDNFANKNNLFNDVWKFNTSNNQWTWMAGSNTGAATAVYGTKGVPSTSNTPGARRESACWFDDTGYFWIFGGMDTSSTNYNDLWRFNPSTSEWTWMTGSNTANAIGSFGTKGVASASNVPPARERMACWKGPNNTLWFFGGYDNANAGRMNDLWKYDVATNQWTWMSGSNVKGAASVYGVRGTSSATTVPGARRLGASVAATDSAGNFWLFGGDEYVTNVEVHNDLWKYSPSTNQWTWVSGLNGPDQVGVYGTKLVANPSNVPGARRIQITAAGKAGEVWILLGYGTAEFGDFWAYSNYTDQWTWLSGLSTTNGAASYGTLGVAAATNTPGGRDSALAWVDSKGNLWVYGGGISNSFGDLWKAIRY